MTAPQEPYLVPPVPSFTLPVALGGAFSCNFVYMPLVVDTNGNPVLDASGNRQYAEANYPSDATVVLSIQTDPTQNTVEDFPASISGAVAAVIVPRSTSDALVNRMLWRLTMTRGTGEPKVLCNGIIMREDGKPSL